MKIPDSFKEAIANTFMDKEVSLRALVETTGSLGSVTRGPASTSSGTYSCNLQVISDAITAQEWGLTIGQDAKLTATEAIPCKRGDYLDYKAQVFRIEGILQRDSHQVLMLKYLPGEAVLSE